MGYELTRFIGEIDEEFHCSICTMVLEDPVQTPCEHSFCNECIKHWLPINGSCPTDRTPLTISDLKPASRPFRNLWNKLDIKCNFQAQGCSAIIKLENLIGHVGSCEYNSVVVCDQGCSMRITRREYESDNCLLHLTNRVNAQENEIKKLLHLLSDQKEHFERIINGLKEENRKLINETRGQHNDIRRIVNDDMSRNTSRVEQETIGQHDDITRIINDEVSRLEHFENLRNQQEHTAAAAAVEDKSNTSLKPLKWQLRDNVTVDQSNILKIVDPSRKGCVHSDYPLQPGKSSFKVHAMRIENRKSSIGLSLAFGSIFYRASGDIHVDDAKVYVGARWEWADTIKCGIKFPPNFVNDGNHRATVYFYRNAESIFEVSIKIPQYIYPTIYLYGSGTRLKYFQKL